MAYITSKKTRSKLFYFIQEKSQPAPEKETAGKSSGKEKKKNKKKEKNTMSLDQFNQYDSQSSSKHNSGMLLLNVLKCL